jgi:hypothetical protein
MYLKDFSREKKSAERREGANKTDFLGEFEVSITAA